MYTYEDVIETLALRAASRYLTKQPIPWSMTEEDKVFVKSFGQDEIAVEFGVSCLFQPAVLYLMGK